ncbi:MAG: GIY-YIG nuclease family protein, partial [Candidatus Omnitrophica bacterium]|nr:GIY-YIG nuclease family protein [Candidatus Omnitrophota bacterium]
MEPSLQERLKQLPDRPGVYLFKDREGRLLYVGKALSLRHRVLSYFQPSRPLGPKLTQLVRNTSTLDWIPTGSEAEALLYEQGFIREKQPKYNVLFRDDKSYPYLKVTAEEEFPRLFIGRGPSDPGVKRIGPFANAGLLKQAFSAIRRVIPFRTCKTLPKRACLDYHLRLCSAPCEGRISREEYREDLSKVFRVMEGKKEEVLEELRRRMEEHSRGRRYEEAAKIRDQVAGLLELASRPRRFIPAQALGDLQAVLQLPRVPRRIEGFDVSNIFGREPVGSMVTFVDGKPWKDGYRRFKIKTVFRIDDYAMMREIVRRRYTDRYLVPKVPGTDLDFPDLVLIDGGRGHLNAALEVLKELKLGLPAVG